MISEEEEGSMVEKPRELGGRARRVEGLGGPAVAVKPRAPRWLSPAQLSLKM